MNKTKLYQVVIEISGTDSRWERTFVGLPTKSEVAEVLEKERLTRRQKHIDSGSMPRVKMVDSLYRSRTTLVWQNELPISPLATVCEYNGEVVGHIRIMEGDGVWVTAESNA